MYDLVNVTLANPVLDVLLPFFSVPYLFVPSLVILAALFYAGTGRLRGHILRIVLALLLAGLALRAVGGSANSFPPCLSGHGRAFVNNTWQSLLPGDLAPVPIEPIRPLPYAASLSIIMLLGLAGIRRWTLWLTVPLNVCALLAPVYCGWCWPGPTFAAWGIGAALSLLIHVLTGGGDMARTASPVGLLRELPRERRLLAMILVLWTMAGLVCVYYLDYVHFEIMADDCQFWYWTRHLQLCYYSKPPMIAVVHYCLASLFGNTASALRAGGVVIVATAFIPVYALTLRITGRERPALLAVILLAAVPEYFQGGTMFTDTNVVAYPIWALALYTAHRAFHGERRMWALTGLLVGLGLLTRYTFPFLAVALALIVIVFFPRHLKHRGPYVAFLCGLACILGWLYWQYEHHWVTLEDIEYNTKAYNWAPEERSSTIFYFLVMQMFCVSPVIFLLFLFGAGAAAVKSVKNPDAGMLLLAFLVPFIPFLAISYKQQVELVWPSAAYLAAAPAAAWVITDSRRQRLMKVLLATGVFVSIAITLLLHVEKQYAERPFPFREVPKLIRAQYSTHDGEIPFLFTTAYGDAVRLSFYTPGHPDVPCAGGTQPCHDICLWTDWGALAGRDALLFVKTDKDNVDTRSSKKIVDDWIDKFVYNGAFMGGECVDYVEFNRSDQKRTAAMLIHFRCFSGQDMCNDR